MLAKECADVSFFICGVLFLLRLVLCGCGPMSVVPQADAGKYEPTGKWQQSWGHTGPSSGLLVNLNNQNKPTTCDKVLKSLQANNAMCDQFLYGHNSVVTPSGRIDLKLRLPMALVSKGAPEKHTADSVGLTVFKKGNGIGKWCWVLQGNSAPGKGTVCFSNLLLLFNVSFLVIGSNLKE